LMEIRAKTRTPVKVFVRIEVGDGKIIPTTQVTKEINTLLKDVKEDFEVK